MSYSIYRLTSPSGAIYIGQTCRVETRLATYAAYRCQRQPKLYACLRKYGFANFRVDVLDSDLSEAEADAAERRHIESVPAAHRLNLTAGGEGTTGHRHSEATKVRVGTASAEKFKRRPELVQASRERATRIFGASTMREKASERAKAMHADPEFRCRFLCRINSPDFVAQSTAIIRAVNADPANLAEATRRIRKVNENPELRRKCLENLRAKQQEPEFAAALKAQAAKLVTDPELLARTKAGKAAWASDPANVRAWKAKISATRQKPIPEYADHFGELRKVEPKQPKYKTPWARACKALWKREYKKRKDAQMA